LAIVLAPVLLRLWTWSSRFPTFAWQSILTGSASSLTTCCWLIAFLGLGYRYLNVTSKVLRYATQAAYPFYILHLPVNTLVGYFVIQWNASIAVKYLVINVFTIALTLAVYDAFVKRTAVTRFLFGMKPLAKVQTPRSTMQTVP
jgi:peptidoglycan/LPS O-acetylase OafA/YrhL